MVRRHRLSVHVGRTLFGSRFRFSLFVLLAGIIFEILGLLFVLLLYNSTIAIVSGTSIPLLYIEIISVTPIIIIGTGLLLILVGKGTQMQVNGAALVLIGASLSFLFDSLGGFVIGGTLLFIGGVLSLKRF